MPEYAPESLDPSVFERSLQVAFPIICQRLKSRFGDPQLAEEVSWDCLTHAYEVWQADPHYFDTRDLTSWSSQRASWRALDRLRERTRFSPLVEEHPGEEDESPTPATRLPTFNHDEAQQHLQDRFLAWECLGKLDEEDRFILCEHYYAGRSDQEIGTDLYGTEGSAQARGLRVWRRRQKAQARLKDLLISHGFEAGATGAQAV